MSAFSTDDIMRRRPKCACCGHRHGIGMAVSYYDPLDDVWRCARCDHPINGDGECSPDCCGWAPQRRRAVPRPVSSPDQGDH